MAHDNLEEFEDPVNYDREEGPGAERRIAWYVALAERVGGPVLELACGTGLVALPIASAGLRVTGVDLATPMLAHAAAKARALGLHHAEWHRADIRTVRLPGRFRLVVLTGNAFQAMLTRADQHALLETVARHLDDDGVFAFETRNPAGHDLRDQPDEEAWLTYESAEGHAVSCSFTQRFDAATQVMHWTTFRRWQAEGRPHERVSRIACRFLPFDALAALLAEHGLEISARHGDWDGAPPRDGDEEFILQCRRRRAAG